ncbi:MAG: hypothetical protein H6606_05870 [Flavobacteriales bacterium]|nr:hypothetical protein [Flavobacteriales bacterium]
MENLIVESTIPGLVLAAAITVVIGIGLALLVVGALYYFYRKASGSKTAGVTLSITYDNALIANPAPGIPFTLLTKFKGSNNVSGNQTVKVTILPGTDGKITSSIGGKTSLEVKTDVFGDGSFVINGSEAGADVVRIEFASDSYEFQYETSDQ